MIPLNINFLKSQPTVGELRKLTREAQSTIKSRLVISGGDKFVARQGNNQYPQDVSEGSSTSYPSKPNTSLKPQTLNYTKLNNARRNLEWQQVEKELGLIQL